MSFVRKRHHMSDRLECLQALGLERQIAVIVAGFPAAPAVAATPDPVSLVPRSFLQAESRAGLFRFELPVPATPITVSRL